MPYLFNLIFALLLTFYVGNQQVMIQINDDQQVQIKVKKDQKRLNKSEVETSNIYANNKEHKEKFF